MPRAGLAGRLAGPAVGFAVRGQGAGGAVRAAGFANVAAVENQPVVSCRYQFLGDVPQQRALRLERRL